MTNFSSVTAPPTSGDFSIRAPKKVSPAATDPEQVFKTFEEAVAAHRAANPPLTPQEAFASGAELGPPTDDIRADNHGSKIHTEIKVNGKVIARLYNSGGAEYADEYAFLGDEIDFAADTMTGPELAVSRANRIKAVLEKYGAFAAEKIDAETLMAARSAKRPVVEMLQAATAQTQAEWLAMKAGEGREPGGVLSRSA
jgi:hypothetical protein